MEKRRREIKAFIDERWPDPETPTKKQMKELIFELQAKHKTVEYNSISGVKAVTPLEEATIKKDIKTILSQRKH